MVVAVPAVWYTSVEVAAAELAVGVKPEGLADTFWIPKHKTVSATIKRASRLPRSSCRVRRVIEIYL